MYGQKVKLDLDKIKNRKEKTAEPVEEAPAEPVVDEVVEDVPEEPVVDEVVEEVVEDVPEEPVVEQKPAKEKSKQGSKLDDLKIKLKEKDEKLSNQSSELNYLTNKIIPKLKKENALMKAKIVSNNNL